MSERLRRRIASLEARLTPRVLSREEEEQEARSRIYRGSASWSDHELLGGRWVEDWRDELLARLPLALAEPGWRQWSSTNVFYLDPLLMILTAPPGQPLSTEQHALVADIDRRWADDGPDISDRLLWAVHRLALGADGGSALRDSCWHNAHGRPTISGDVLSASHMALLTWREACDLIGAPAVTRMAEQTMGDRLDDLFDRFAATGRHRPDRALHLHLSRLELALLIDGSPLPSWFGSSGRSWWAGHNWSDQVTSADAYAETPMPELVADQLVARATSTLVRQMSEPRVWRETFAERAAARKAGWEVEREYLLAESRRNEARARLLPDV